MRAKTLGFAISLLLGAGAGWACDQDKAARSDSARIGQAAAAEAPAGTEKAVLRVGKKMACSSCSGKIEAALRKLDGVKAVHVDRGRSEAVVHYVGAKVTPEALIAAVADLKYDITLAK